MKGEKFMAGKEEFYLKGIVNEVKELRKSVDKLTAAVQNMQAANKPECHYAAHYLHLNHDICMLDPENTHPCIGYDGCDFFTQN